MAHLLGAENLSLEFPTKTVFDAVTLGLSEGDRIGIVGRNGDGKSSLLGMLSGRVTPDAGRITVRNGVHIGSLAQEDSFEPGDTVRRAIVGDVDEHVWASDPRIRDVLAGLVADIDLEAPVDGLSGGQRRRVSLARLLVGDWDVLALDEPTNHLDVEAIAWLAGHIKTRWPRNRGGLLVVTHDRWFLDEICTATWEVHDRIVEPFEGGYAAYVLQRVERDRQAAAIEARRQNLARKELAWLRRGAPARTSKPKFRIDAANALIENVPEIRNDIALRALALGRLGKDVVDIVDVSVSYGEHLVLSGINWKLAPGERTGILGINGAGKSTLLNLITQAVQPTAGRVKFGKTISVATLTQGTDRLAKHSDEPVHQLISTLRTEFTFGDGSKAQSLSPSQLLEQLGFASEQLATPIRDLSGGQKRRLQLLLVLLEQPNVLILDEPTNDLDTDMLTALEDLLDSWAGTLIVVSHDRYFLERVTDQQYAVMGGSLRHLPGGVDEYLRLRANTKTSPQTPPSSQPANNPPAAEDSPQLSGAQLHAARKELAATERRMGKLENDIARVNELIAQADPSDFVELQKLAERLNASETEFALLEDQWLELSELVG